MYIYINKFIRLISLIFKKIFFFLVIKKFCCLVLGKTTITNVSPLLRRSFIITPSLELQMPVKSNGTYIQELENLEMFL